jgi:hypothetical protein
MKCSTNCLFMELGLHEARCKITDSPAGQDDCHCDAKRVKRLLEQVPEVRELLRDVIECAEKLPSNMVSMAEVRRMELSFGSVIKHLGKRARALVGGE